MLTWAAIALGYTVTQASALQGVVAIGMAVGAVVASLRMKLEDGPRVIPMGIGMGVLMIALIFIDNVWLAAPFLILLGGIGGYLVVLLSYRRVLFDLHRGALGCTSAARGSVDSAARRERITP